MTSMALEHVSKDDLRDLLIQVVKDTIEPHMLSDEEIMWVRMAIRAEAERAEFRKAVIEKTFVGFLSAVLLGTGAYFFEIIKSHWKP